MPEVMLNILWYVIQVAVGIHLVVPVLFYLASRFRRHQAEKPGIPTQADYAVIVTAHKFTNGVTAAVESLLEMKYERYMIYVVADNCNRDELHFEDPRVMVLYPDEVLASNIRSHFYAIERFIRAHERLTIIDSDNLVDPEYLNELDYWFARGYQAVQGIRLPRNLDTTLACLDAARDIYYHYYDGKILHQLGSSATLAGSGMAFTVDLYRECLAGYQMEGAGFDKVLQAEIVKRDLRIAFAGDAKVYDAKTSRPAELVSQRSRWIGTWFRFFRLGFGLIGTGLARFSRNQLLFGLILLRPPLFIFLILSALLSLANLFIDPVVVFVWTAVFVLFLAGFVTALIRSRADKRIYSAFFYIPQFIFLQVLALSKFILKRKAPVSTKHSL